MVTNIGQLIDSNIVEYINYIDSLNFSECVGTKKLLEAELGRTHLLRDKYFSEMEMGIDRVKDYVATFVVEQKIIDRLEITESIKTAKGINLNVFTCGVQ